MRLTRSAMRRYISTRLSALRFGEKNVSGEPKRMASSSRRNTPPTSTPPLPAYVPNTFASPRG